MTYSREREAAFSKNLTVGPYLISSKASKSQQPLISRPGRFRVFKGTQEMGIMSPALKFFPNQQAPVGRAVYQSSLSEDIYLILSGFSELDKNQATLKVLVRPLVIWMWIGGFIILLGTLVSILPLKKAGADEE
jgi:cytochrome c-type biogenesis protein CcmF